jgi:choline dehydrogenase
MERAYLWELKSQQASQVQSDDELLDYARRSGSTCYHANCTCVRGSHAIAVLDDELKVHRLEGLRVIDASEMPAVTSTNPNAPTIIIAEEGRHDKGLSAKKTGGRNEGARSTGGPKPGAHSP